jgi:DNA-binding MarR family transcriptional regulator
MFLFSRRKAVTVTDACAATNAPRTTAMRHLEELVQNGLVDRRGVSTDRRIQLLTLSAAGRTVMEAYSVKRAGLEQSTRT